MSLHVLADHMASKGRGPDSMLVHMSPREVAGLHALALKHGGSLTINPETGLPEAGFLDKLLPAIIGGALVVTTGMDPMTAAALVGGTETARTGSLERGLMAGFGAWGGAGTAAGFTGAGSGALANEAGALANEAGALAGTEAAAYGTDLATIYPSSFTPEAIEVLKRQAIDQGSMMAGPGMQPTTGDIFSKGFKEVTKSPSAMGQFAKDNFKYLAGAAAPILADKMVPTTTKAPPVSPSFIRQKIVNPDGTVRDLTPVNAADFGSRNFSDVYRGYNGGGIVALAGGGTGNISSVEDLYTQVLGRAPDAGGLAYWQQGFGDTIDANEIASFKQAAQAELANRSAPEQQILAPNLVNTTGTAAPATSVADLYQGILGRAPESAAAASYWQNQFGNTIDANELAQFKTAAQAEIDARNTGTTGGLANLATTGGTSLADAQAQVNNMYRNVLGRDADPTGLAFWSNAIASGRPAESIYQDFLTSARANTELVRADQIKNKTFAEATTPYKGYMSSDTSNIVDEWVRTTLGREPTDLDKQQQWYKDAANKMTTQGEAQGLFGQFKTYAGTEASKEMANRIKAIDAELRAKNLTEADLLTQTGKTKQQLASEGLNTNLNLMSASQLTPAGSRTAYDLKAKLAALKPVTTTQTVLGTNPQTNAPAGTTNPYGNINNPGDITFNPDGSRTITPNIPGRPYGGFSGIGEVRNAYTQGGGSLGYTSPVVKTAEELDAAYNKQTGDSLAAYNYLMGKGANPVKSGVGQISRPYSEATMGFPASTNKMYNWDAASGKMVRNPDYVAANRNSKGDVTYGMSLNDIKKYLNNKPLQGASLYNWAKENSLSAQDIADATGMTLSEVYSQFREGQVANKAMPETPAEIPSGATGGAVGYAVGGGLGTLGGYSDGGRLLKGPGDGVSDSIPATIGAKNQPARLADGEFVVPARIVSELGNGSTDAGAKKLYAMMDRVQRARGKTTGKNKVAANSRADRYLPA